MKAITSSAVVSLTCLSITVLLLLIGNVHRSVLGFLYPLAITIPLYITSQCDLLNVTVHPALHNTLIPINEATVRLGTMWPVSTVGRPGIVMSHSCVDFTFVPSGRLMVSGCCATLLLSTGALSMTNIAVAPVSNIACDSSIPMFCFCCNGIGCLAVVVAMVLCWGMVSCSCVRYAVVLDIITVLSSSSFSSLVTTTL